MKILRTAVGSLVSLGLIKELESYGIEVIGVDSEPNSFGHLYLKKAYVVPEGRRCDFIEKIINIVRNEKIDAILPGVNEELINLSLNRALFKMEKCALLLSKYPYINMCVDKFLTYLHFEGYNIPYPKTYRSCDVKYPCFIKNRFGSGSKNCFKIDNEKLLKEITDKQDIIVQEFVEGTEYSIDTLSNKKGEAICVVPRIRQKVRGGLSIQGETVYDEEIIFYAKKILKLFNLFGPACIQCFRDKEGRLKFTDINNRFGGGSVLSIKACPDFIPCLIDLVYDNKFKTDKLCYFKEGMIMVRNFTEIYYERGK